MKPRLLFTLLVVPVLAFAAVRWLKPVPAQPGGAPAAPAAALQQPGAAPSAHPAPASLVMRHVEVRGLDGRIAWRGDVDLAPVLARIAAGERDPHRNDGGIFGNREGVLPPQRRGYYHEYVLRTPGLSGPGPQRLVLGARGEVYYSADHYASFRRVR